MANGLLQRQARQLAKHGRKGDKLLAHITPEEARHLKARGGAGTRNPKTGLLEFWDSDGDGESDGHSDRDGSDLGGGSGSQGGGGSDSGSSGDGIGGSWSERENWRDQEDRESQGSSHGERDDGGDREFDLTGLNELDVQDRMFELDRRSNVRADMGFVERAADWAGHGIKDAFNEFAENPVGSMIDAGVGLLGGATLGLANRGLSATTGQGIGGHLTGAVRDLSGYGKTVTAEAMGLSPSAGPAADTSIGPAANQGTQVAAADGVGGVGVDTADPPPVDRPIVEATPSSTPKGLLDSSHMGYMASQPERQTVASRFSPDSYTRGRYEFNADTGMIDFIPA